MQLKPINQQVVTVVGASSGIGREAALQFAKRGAKLVVSARSESKLASLVHEIRGFGGEITAVVADVTVFEQVKAIADLTREVYGRLDTWVHCPAIAVYSPFDQTTPEEFQRVIDVGLMGQVYGAMAALPHLKHEGRGALIHVSSVLGRRSLDFNNLTIPSVSDWLDKNPPLKWGAIAGMLALTLLAAQAFKNGGQI